MLIRAALMLPTADRTCSTPRQYGRARSGITSATSATPTANSPPTPMPVRKRYRAKSQKLRLTALRPVNIEYIRIVMIIVLARPMRSPMTPKINPPMPQPIRKIDVA